VNLNLEAATQATLSPFSILGNEFDPTSKLRPEVEANLVQVYERADAIEQVDVQGRTAVPLAEAVDASGAPFPGFTAGGAGWVGLERTPCTRPAPVILRRGDLR
jgi:hypothetical protein